MPLVEGTQACQIPLPLLRVMIHDQDGSVYHSPDLERKTEEGERAAHFGTARGMLAK